MKLFIAILALMLPLFLLAPLAYGAVGIGADYPYGAGDTGPATAHKINIVHPSASAVTSGLFFTFMPELDGGTLVAFQLLLVKTGSPVGYLCADLYATTGNYGSTAVPTGASLERSIISLDVTMASVQTSAAYVWFNFSSAVALDAGTVYALAVEEVNETTCDTSNCAGLYYDNVGSYGGNCGYYQSGGWTSLGASIDACFVVYQDGGDLVSYFGGNTYVTQQVTNVTAIVNGTEVSFNNTNVSAGDVNADGAVTVSGSVTNNFNNTAVSASGDITAGAVTAGDVTADGAVTVAGGVNVNGTFENATLTYLTSTSVSGDANVYFLIAFIGLAVLLTFYNKVPLLNFLVGVVGISFIMLTIAKTDLPFWPYSSVLLALTSVLCMFSGGFKMRSG